MNEKIITSTKSEMYTIKTKNRFHLPLTICSFLPQFVIYSTIYKRSLQRPEVSLVYLCIVIKIYFISHILNILNTNRKKNGTNKLFPEQIIIQDHDVGILFDSFLIHRRYGNRTIVIQSNSYQIVFAECCQQLV